MVRKFTSSDNEGIGRGPLFLASMHRVVVAQWSEHWRLRPGALGSIPDGCPDVFSSNKLSDVDRVMSSMVL